MYIRRLAGTGIAGLRDGEGTRAQFHEPSGLALDASGNLYVADMENHCIRKVTPNGHVTSVAGDGVEGFLNGPATVARFTYPDGLAIDAHGNLLIADSGNHCLRMMTPDGLVSTFAGSGTDGHADGPCQEAMFRSPTGIAVHPNGNILVADHEDNRIRVVSPKGVVCTLAGAGIGGCLDGDFGVAQFSGPYGVAVNSKGDLVVVDNASNCLRKLSNGKVSTIAGIAEEGFIDGPGDAARFCDPYYIVIDGEGNIIVSDCGNYSIRMINTDGEVFTLPITGNTRAWPPGSSSVLSGYCRGPTGMVIDAHGNLIVASREDHSIYIINANLKPPCLPNEKTALPVVVTLHSRMAALFDDSSYSDVTFMVEGQVIPAHRCILAPRSEYFTSLFAAPFEEATSRHIWITDTTAAAFRAFLKYLYTDEVVFDDDVVIGVLKLCHQYQIDDGYTRIDQYCRNRIDINNAAPWLVECHVAQLEQLKAYVLQFVVHHLAQIRSEAVESAWVLKYHPDIMYEIIIGTPVSNAEAPH